MKTRAILVLAAATIGITACQTLGDKTTKGAGIGAAAGALAGAIIGHQTGNRGNGMLIGAAAGTLVGGALGRKMDKQAAELAKVAETKRTEDGAILTKLKSDILFDSGKSAVKPVAVTNLKEIGNILKQYPENRIMVVGHTDSTGSEDLNKQLSMQRADSVRTQLVNAGVPGAHIDTTGVGPTMPVADNKTATGRAQNRRVELQIVMVPEGQTATN